MVRVLIGSRYGTDVEGLLNDAPSEAEVTFLPDGEKLADHLSRLRFCLVYSPNPTLTAPMR